jgi:carboxyl-terminal processing protease
MWKAVKRGILSLAVALVIVLAGVVGYTLGQDDDGQVITSKSTAATSANEGFSILDEIYRVLEEDFVNPDIVDPEVLQIGAINGLLQALGDAHTVYIDPQSYALGTDIVSGTFQGIGAQVEQDPVTTEIVIVTPFRDSPAEEAGIRPGDIIRAVDSQSTEGWTVTQAVQRIRGEEGTEVTLTIQHRDGSVEDVTIVRATIVVPTVFTNVGDGPDLEIIDARGNPVADIAYVEIQQITEQTVRDLSRVLERARDDQYGALILDVRRNPGGGLDATVDVADMFLDGGLILTQVDRDGRETTYEAKGGGEALDIPLVLLVGPGSASGAEVLAGALRDQERATLIGETTFGKGSINQLRRLSDGGALYVTTGRWLTPNGEQIEGLGLAPDVEVMLTEEDLQLRRDPQLLAAIDYLRQNYLQAQP